MSKSVKSNGFQSQILKFGGCSPSLIPEGCFKGSEISATKDS
jgi:hypothetical protein